MPHYKSLLAVCLAASLMGCGSTNTETPAASLPANGYSNPVDDKPSTLSWQCPGDPGTAPSGELFATRIPAANTTRNEAGLFEGPVWIGDSLYFSDFTFADGFPSRVQRLGPDGAVSIVIDDSGSNGLAVDWDGYLLAATHDRKAVSRYNLETGAREIIIDEFDGNPFNSPNDLTMTRSGVIYFTDPDFQRSAAPGGQPKTRVYRVDQNGVHIIDDTMGNPNGVSLSPDESTLYVAGGGQNGVLRAYRLQDGVVAETRNLAALTNPDGMAIDCLGNIYATEHTEQRIRVFSPQGEQIAIIRVDANITNAAFGGPDRKTLYITGAGAVWKLDLQIAGFPY